ncbi:hypothetical protein M9458_011828, partial [Cirrhinus mrigala]
DKYNPYTNCSPSDSDLDRRYCVLKLHVPYRDLLQAPDSNSEWAARCQPGSYYY